MEIEFKTIDIERDFSKCFHFRKDSHINSFGNLDGFESFNKGYRERIQSRLQSKQWFYFHIWINSEIVGQIEFRSFSDEPNLGYVQLIYVAENFRGKGVSDKAQEFIRKSLIDSGCYGAILSVSRANKRALKHYDKFGWKYFKPNLKHELTDYYLVRYK